MKTSSKKIICGIDVGTTKICTIIVEVDKESFLKILSVGIAPSMGLKKGVIVDLKLASKAIFDSVQQAEKVANVMIDSAYLGVSGSHIRSDIGYGAVNVLLPTEGITVEDKKRTLNSSKTILLQPNREIIDVIEREYVVDGQGGIKDPIGMVGRRLEVTTSIITGTSTFLRNLQKCADNIGLKVKDFVLQPIASGEAVLNEDEKEIGVALIDIGGGTTDLAIFHRGSLCHIKVFPVGGNHIDNDIAVGLGTSHVEAERLKIRYGKACITGNIDESEPIDIHKVGGSEKTKIPLGLLYQIIEPRLTELFSLIYKELEETGYIDNIPSGVVITGGGALLNSISQLASISLNTVVRIGYPKNINTITEKISSPIYATAIGLIKCGIEKLSKEEETFSSTTIFSKFVNVFNDFFTVFK